MERTPTIAIAGAGLGGLTAAILLARAGFRVLLFEREPALSTAGAGIQLTPNAGHVLAGLGLDGAIADVAAEPAFIDVGSGRSGRRIVAMPLGARFASRYGLPYRTIHRADLHGILSAAAAAEPGVELLLGHEVVEFADHPNGVTIITESTTGDAEFTASALIGADGAASRIRAVLQGAAERRLTGQVAWRLIVPKAVLPAGLAVDTVGLWLGPGGHVVHYPVRRGDEFNVVAVVSEDEHQANLAGMRQRLGQWAEPVRSLLALEGDWRRWPISVVDPRRAWTDGRAAILGDAAHAMAPYLAQGGAMAIEDAAVLARVLDANRFDIPEAMTRYEAERRPRVRRVWRSANTTADLYHMGLLTGAVRDAGMRILGGKMLLRRYGWIYRWRVGA